MPGAVAFEPNDVGIARHVPPLNREPEPGLEEDRNLAGREITRRGDDLIVVMLSPCFGPFRREITCGEHT
jgi:hypothetical protein